MVPGWLKACYTSHSKCPKLAEAPLPTRVIDVGSKTVKPRLVISGGLPGKWVALSHCWGPDKASQPLKTELATIDQHCRELSFDSLPASFKDAVTITRFLGIQYLWIDSLCIVQDSAEDWLAESAFMGGVYKDAVFTIGAEDAGSSREGIFGSCDLGRKERKTSLIKTSAHSSSIGKESELYLRVHFGPTIDDRRGILGTRGWTLQEEILSPRMIQFTTRGTTWRCLESSFIEEFPETPGLHEYNIKLPLPDCYLSSFQGLDGKSSALPYWYGTVTARYQSRNLTFYSDTLPAIAGIAKELQPYIGNGQYKAGLWLDDFHRALLWLPLRIMGEEVGPSRHPKYIAPSWSWASLDLRQCGEQTRTANIYTGMVENDLQPLANILQVDIKNVDDDPFGQVISASLVLEGEMHSVCRCVIPLCFLDEGWRYMAAGYDSLDEDVVAFRLGSMRWYKGNRRFSRHLKDAVTEPCFSLSGWSHEPLKYIKIARILRNPIVPGQDIKYNSEIIVALIVKGVSTEGGVKYERVGRAMMHTDGAENEVTWPIEIATII